MNITIVYYNDNDPLFPWIVEHGSEVILAKKVVTSNIIGITKENLGADNVKRPRAWFEFHEARVSKEKLGLVRIYS